MYRLITIIVSVVAVAAMFAGSAHAGNFTLFNFGGGGRASAARAYNRGYAAARSGGSGGVTVQVQGVVPMQSYGVGAGSTGGTGGYRAAGSNGGAGGYTAGEGSAGGMGGAVQQGYYVPRSTVAYRPTTYRTVYRARGSCPPGAVCP